MDFNHNVRDPIVTSFKCNFENCYRLFSSKKNLEAHCKNEHESKHTDTPNIIKANDAVKENEEFETGIIDTLLNSQNVTYNKLEKQQATFLSNENTHMTDLFRKLKQSGNENDFEGNFSDELITSLFQSALLLMSTFHADHTLNRSQIQNFISSFHKFLNSPFMNKLKKLILSNIKQDMIETIDQKFSSLQGICLNLNTEHKRFKYLEEHKLYIKPQPVDFGTAQREKKGKLETAVVKGQLIPLDVVLKTFFELPGVFDQTYEYYSDLLNDTNSISNVVQTEMWKQTVNDVQGSVIFPLYLFEDAFETGNPLGPNAGKHKVNAVYTSVACLPPEHRSKLVNINLLQLYYADDLHDFSREKIFEKMISLLNNLYSEGVTLELEGNRRIVVRFKVVGILGDNLGVNSILGFAQGFTANYFCRFCKIHKSEAKSLCSEKKDYLRNEQNYDKDVKLKNLETTGINEACVFHNLHDFHVTKNKSVDLMHDLLEGLCRVEMFHLVYHCIKKANYFTLKTMNHRLAFFKFNDSDNRPALISETNITNKNLKMTASQMLSFVLNFGIIFGDLINDRNDKFWKLYKLLRELLCISLKCKINSSTPQYFSKLVKSHHELYIELLGPLFPKEHFLTHYPAVMKEMGPVVNFWSMRYEAKHLPFKKYSNVTCNRINLCLSLAVRNQLAQSDSFLQQQAFTLPCISYSKFRTSCAVKIEYESVKYVTVKNIHINGATLVKNITILLEIDNNIPSFAKICNIYKNASKFEDLTAKDFLLHVQQIRTVTFDDHFQAHEVEETENYKFTFLNMVVNYKSWMTIPKNDKLFIVYYDSLKSSLYESIQD